MAAGRVTFLMTNGQTLDMYDTSSEPVNAEKRFNLQGTAVSTSPYGFVVMSKTCIKDAIVLTSVDGEIEFTRNGQRTGKKFGIHAGLAYDKDRRTQKFPKYCFEPGIRYGAIQTVARSA